MNLRSEHGIRRFYSGPKYHKIDPSHLVKLPLPLGDGYMDVAGRAMQEVKAEGWGGSGFLVCICSDRLRVSPRCELLFCCCPKK